MNGRLTVLNYHNIALAPPEALLPKLYVDPRMFARQMWCLKRLGLRGVSMSEGLWHLERGRAGRVVALTFDDGYVDNLQHAASILRDYGFSATCFIVTGCLGAYNLWDAEVLRVRKPVMDARELKAWLGEGLELGSHTRSHPHLTQLDSDAAEAEIVGSRADLERVAGVKIEHFCYPYGSVSDRLARQVEAAGYRSAVTTQRGLARIQDNRFLLPRVSINGRRGLLRFTLKAATPYGAWRRVRVAA
jgi:peptidoglycan/xylan/chitin deacetylase (PgdA/CDA1 family)